MSPEMSFNVMNRLLKKLEKIENNSIRFKYCTLSDYFGAVEKELKTSSKPVVSQKKKLAN